MRHFIFVTTEGTTYLPESDSPESDVDNAQVLGFSEGNDVKDAFNNLLIKEGWLKETAFNEVIVYELANSEVQGYCYIQDN